jgi:tRNA threonylcarbamoyl adenosine modification protein YeaZ
VNLLLDSSGSYLVAALADGQGRILASSAHPSGSPESRDLSAVVDALLDTTGRPVLTGVIAGTGPGTFIGTRMAVSFANGLAATAGCDLRGVSSLGALAAIEPQGTAVIRDARQDLAYLYLNHNGIHETLLVPVGELAGRIVAAGAAHAVFEASRPGDAKGARRVAAIADSLTGSIDYSVVDRVPPEGLWRAAKGLGKQDYIEPEYYKGFL